MAGFFLPSFILLSFFPLRTALIGRCASKCRHTDGLLVVGFWLLWVTLLSCLWEIDETSVRIEEEREED